MRQLQVHKPQRCHRPPARIRLVFTPTCKNKRQHDGSRRERLPALAAVSTMPTVSL